MKILIVGGGISGCFSAIELARAGHNVKILEKKDRILKKMLVTGNGRCNLTNSKLSTNNYNNYEFVKYGLENFNNEVFREYLKTLGILTVEEEQNRIYPLTLKAQSVVNLILYELEDLGVEILTQSSVIDIKKDEGIFKLKTNENEYIADIVIFAVGGSSAPKLGSDGKSYKILEKLGHKLTPIYPSLSQIELDSKFLKHLSGVKVIGTVSLFYNDNLLKTEKGEILFTNYGISGPPVLNLSKYVNLNNDKDLYVKLPLLNILEDEKKLRDLILNQFYLLNDYSLERWLSGLVDKKFINYILDKVLLEKDIKIGSIEKDKLNKLIDILFESRFKVIKTRGFENSHVSAGGFKLEEVDRESMESKKVENLYIIGETLDIDGDCGGYNIQWAFSSAMCATRAISFKNYSHMV